MSESMSPSWIRDYLIGVAETHGAQLYNAPVTKVKKKVQLTDVRLSSIRRPRLIVSS